ncbi:Type I secretion target repeat protein [Sulfitobacter noctilucae]|uniref:Hint domain-containing protein n=1 Tax=Sulfitobacter noctilucae TaxID=1342302 RepID=UPI00046AC5CB|nr:Hint domain-containing protein [Sulfitobacter noctilucae]KIN65326.1 Type I secretion target repeat protein [Sulfitobacter noctilucae]
MPVTSVQVYEFDPLGAFETATNFSRVYSGPATADGSAVITDNAAGTGSAFLEDVAVETATATTVLNGVTDNTARQIYAEEAWTLRDEETGRIFQLITFRVNAGPNTGYYTLSEIPLVQGREYTTLDYDTTPNTANGDDTFSYADYAVSDGIVSGTAGDDVIDGSYNGDPGNDVVDGNDAPGAAAPTPLDFNWSGYADEQDLRNLAAPQDTGGINVTVGYSDVQTNEEFSAELSGGTNNGVYVAPGETFSNNSAGYLFSNGAADDSIITFDFAAVSGSGFVDSVENVAFRISDLDGINNGTNDFQDIVTVRAFDAAGNEIPVNITGGSNHTVVGNTITAGLTNYAPTAAQASALIEIAGPVAQIEVVYGNGGTTGQAIYFSDIEFDAIPVGSNDDSIEAGAGNDIIEAGAGDDTVSGGTGNDTISGGIGSDTLSGDAGDDTLNVGSGDTASGGDGDDTFLIDAGALNGTGLSVVGGEGDETTGDVLDFNGQLLAGSVVLTDSDGPGPGKSGTATLLDGSTVTFSEIESIICFAQGTAVETPYGPRRVEDLAPGDLVLTRDHGPQPLRWVGSRTVAGAGSFAPIQFAPGSIGNKDRLVVSPQHRMLIDDYRASMYFGEDEVLTAAHFLVNGDTVVRREMASVSYFHLLFDTHELVLSGGTWSESYQPGSYSLPGLDDRARDELFRLFPELRSNPNGYGQAVRPSLKRQQGMLLAA